MKNDGPTSVKQMIRDRVAAECITAVERVRVFVTMMPNLDIEVLTLLEKPNQFDLAAELAVYLMWQLGDDSEPENPRFDKTRRVVSKVKAREQRRMAIGAK